MMCALRQMATFVAAASLFLAAQALPSSSKAATSSLQPRFDTKFVMTANQKWICESLDFTTEPIAGASVSDCQDLLGGLLTTNGYWECDGWVQDQNYVYFEIFGSGSCHLSAVAHSDVMTKIGAGDVYAWVYNTIDKNTVGDTASGHGTVQCGDNKLEWSVSSKAGSR